MRKSFFVLIGGLAFMVNTVSAAESAYIDSKNRASVASEQYSMFHQDESFPLSKSDPEFSLMVKKYIYADIASQVSLDKKNASLVNAVAMTTLDADREMLYLAFDEALKQATPYELKESIYHITPYVGFIRVKKSLDVLKDYLADKKISVPEKSFAKTSDTDRFEKGLAFQVGTYGERINQMRAAAPNYQKHLQDDLSAFCFGDFYTRDIFDLKQREFFTIAAIGALGIEPQFKSHVAGTLQAGGTKEEVIGIITALNPYIGFPQTLNLLRCANEVFNSKK